MTRAEASRINGAKSRGPTSAAGKAISSQNNYRHGVYAKRTVVLRSESREEYEETKEAYIRLFEPRNTFEAEAVIDIANARWKIRRIEHQASTMLDLRVATDAPKHRAAVGNLTARTAETLAYDDTCGDRLTTLQMLDRAQNTCHRTITRSLRDILLSRKVIDPAQNPPLPEILAATGIEIPAPPPQPKDECPGTPQNQPESRFEPDPEPEKCKSEPEKPEAKAEPKAKSGPFLVTLILILFLWASQQKPMRPEPAQSKARARPPIAGLRPLDPASDNFHRYSPGGGPFNTFRVDGFETQSAI